MCINFAISHSKFSKCTNKITSFTTKSEGQITSFTTKSKHFFYLFTSKITFSITKYFFTPQCEQFLYVYMRKWSEITVFIFSINKNQSMKRSSYDLRNFVYSLFIVPYIKLKLNLN